MNLGIPLEKKSQSKKSQKIPGFFIWDFFGKKIPKIEKNIKFWDLGIPLEKKSQSQKSQKIPGFFIWDFFGKKIQKIPGIGIPEKSHPKATSGTRLSPLRYLLEDY